MPKAEHAHSISRRRVFNAACSAILFGATGIVPRRARAQDTELERLASGYTQLENALDRHLYSHDNDDPCAGEQAVTNGFQDRLGQTVERMSSTQAWNISGLAAKARVLRMDIGQLDRPAPACCDGLL